MWLGDVSSLGAWFSVFIYKMGVLGIHHSNLPAEVLSNVQLENGRTVICLGLHGTMIL